MLAIHSSFQFHSSAIPNDESPIPPACKALNYGDGVCLTPKVEDAIVDAINRGTDVDTMTVIFLNAYNYGYQNQFFNLLLDRCKEFNLTTYCEINKFESVLLKNDIVLQKNKDESFAMVSTSFSDYIDQDLLEQVDDSFELMGLPTDIAKLVVRHLPAVEFNEQGFDKNVTLFSREGNHDLKRHFIESAIRKNELAYLNKVFSKVNQSNYLRLAQVDLSELDMTGIDLSWADLSCAIMLNTNLKGVPLNSTILYGTELTGEQIAGCNITGANFQGATLTGVVTGELFRAELSGIILINADLQGAIFAYAKLDRAILINVILPRNIPYASFKGAVFKDMDLSPRDGSAYKAKFEGVRMTDVTLGNENSDPGFFKKVRDWII